MDGRGRCLDNVFIERLWRSLKYEAVYAVVAVGGDEERPVPDRDSGQLADGCRPPERPPLGTAEGEAVRDRRRRAGLRIDTDDAPALHLDDVQRAVVGRGDALGTGQPARYRTGGRECLPVVQNLEHRTAPVGQVDVAAVDGEARPVPRCRSR